MPRRAQTINLLIFMKLINMILFQNNQGSDLFGHNEMKILKTLGFSSSSLDRLYLP